MSNKEEVQEEKIAGTVSGGNLNYHQGNNFYIFGNIDDSIPKNIITPFIEAYEKSATKKEPNDLHIYVSSYGGRVDYGFDLITHIERAKSLGVCVNTYVTSVACSCGSLIAVTGSRRYIGERAYHLLHYARGGDYAHNPTMIDRNAENFKFMQRKLVEIYQKYTKLKNIEEKLLADNYMVNGAKACIKVGLADEKL